MEGGGISKRLVRFCMSLVGHFTGGLAMVVVVGCAFFAAMSGSCHCHYGSHWLHYDPGDVQTGLCKGFRLCPHCYFRYFRPPVPAQHR